jgi:hypothetical protein
MEDATVDYYHFYRDYHHAPGQSVQTETVLSARDIRPH